MQLTNTSSRYGAVSQLLHWLTAALVVVLIVTGEAGDIDAGKGGALYLWHTSLGLTVLALVIARIVWRLATPMPDAPPTQPRVAGRIATALHLSFYVLLAALPVSGWLAASADGGAVSFFGFATLPSWSPAGGEEFFEETHEVLGNVLLVLIALHALAALKHHFMDKDDVLSRMLPRSGGSRR